MDINQALPLLAGLSPQQFMQRYWQKKPLLIRQALPGFRALLDRSALFELAGRDEVESRLVVQAPQAPGAMPGAMPGATPAAADEWRMSQGPFKRRALPALSQPNWSLLVQGVDLHHAGVHQLLQQFRFVPDARLDDLMISYATPGGGVGPHFDSYDVFLLQAHGQRRWRIGRQKDLSLREGVPLKILADFEHEQEFVLDPGDMLYLPPRYAHDGVALDECMTYSIGFRAPQGRGLAVELLQLLVDDLVDDAEDDADGDSPKTLYRDPQQPAVATPAAVPEALQAFALDALRQAVLDPDNLHRLLGESLTEPKPQTWFSAPGEPDSVLGGVLGGVVLDRRTRMMYDARHIFINGESYRAGGRDAVLMRALADQRALPAKALQKASAAAQSLLQDWCEAGWVHAGSSAEPGHDGA